jgi:hypothetical protein
LIYLLKFAMNAIFAFIQVFNVQFDDVRNGVVKHEEAWGFIEDRIWWLTRINQIKYWSEYLVHALNILNPRIQFWVDEKNASHVVVPIGLPLLFFFVQEFLVSLFVITVDEFELLSSGTRKEWD